MTKTYKPSADLIKTQLSDAVNMIIEAERHNAGLTSAGKDSPAKLAKFDNAIQLMAWNIADQIITEQKLSAMSSVTIRNSEIYYTGGGIWCGVCQMPDGSWFSGELNSWGTFYTNEEDARECYGDGTPGFIRFATDDDIALLRNLWEQMIKVEQTNVHGLAYYCDEWLDDLKEAEFD